MDTLKKRIKYIKSLPYSDDWKRAQIALATRSDETVKSIRGKNNYQPQTEGSIFNAHPQPDVSNRPADQLYHRLEREARHGD